MCGTCGCGDENSITIRKPGEGNHEHSHTHADGSSHAHTHDHSNNDGHGHGHTHDHDHTHEHSHDHVHPHSDYRSIEIKVEQDILSKNNLLAERNRGYFDAKSISALNKFVNSVKNVGLAMNSVR